MIDLLMDTVQYSILQRSTVYTYLQHITSSVHTWVLDHHGSWIDRGGWQERD